MWVDFKYENLAMFCFYCGKVGHSESSCYDRKSDANHSSLIENPYGDCLRAEMGRSCIRTPRLMEQKNKGEERMQQREK